MRAFILFLLITGFCLTACNNNKPKGITVKSEDGTTTTIDVNKMAASADEMQKRTEELQKLPPLSLDQLKALLPDQLMGAPRSNQNVSSGMGTGIATADYVTNDSTKIKLMIYDCAGNGGAGFYSAQYLGLMNFQQDNDNEYTKTVDFNGGKAVEHHNKSSNDYTLTYFGGDRFLVTLEGENVGPDALKQAAQSINLK